MSETRKVDMTKEQCDAVMEIAHKYEGEACRCEQDAESDFDMANVRYLLQEAKPFRELIDAYYEGTAY